METELGMLEESPQVNMHPDALKATLKRVAIHEFGFKDSPPYTTHLLPK